ncbi:xylulokinase [Pseudoroseomonas wenyumeiae]|uniref:Xylulose kinase n=1 Tax=Teichococcus wenyumeiae TaxID=2478470 RepID=A0A3A9J5T7_9PROT|nr:xylulokinase [Pseudoroseomonas wenyumeiae]RKK02577.1 xylulokinase [Pseudoroseomonas wenyumeiae]RMI20630.1 xylulokinase [Pseudoroseomonas wenyumeiae]
MHLGIDLGTSGVKAVLTGPAGEVLAQATAPLALSSPRPLWSEQDPEDWLRATQAALASLRASRDLSGVRALGLAGQMHGAVLLDASDQVLRPAILWNDGRSGAECAALEQAQPASRGITGNLAMPGFTAPKLLWVRRHEPEIFARTRRVLLPKDWLRLRLTGEAVSEMSDASGTLWLDVAARRWSGAMLEATGLSEAQMPALVEGTAPAGRLRAEMAALLGLPAGIPLAGGAGDNAAGAVGIGCVSPGDAFLSLGTSGVVFVSDPGFLPDPARTVHAFCHCLPGTWHRMSVILSAAAALSWVTRVTGAGSEAALLAEVEQAGLAKPGRLAFLPYLSGERTPHNDPRAAGVFFGLSGTDERADLARAVLEGVAFALADGLEALEALGGRIEALTAIGGGARSTAWLRILSAATARPIRSVIGGEAGPALGAARLARIAAGDGSIAEVCTKPPVAVQYEPEAGLAAALAPRRAAYRRLYPTLQTLFAETVDPEPLA